MCDVVTAPRRPALRLGPGRESTSAGAAASVDGDVLGRLPARRRSASVAGPPLPRRAGRRGSRGAVGRVRRHPALLARGCRASLCGHLHQGSRRPLLHDRRPAVPAGGAPSLAPLRPAWRRVRRRPLRHGHLVRGARVRRARRRLFRRPPVDPARPARRRGSHPFLDEAPRARLRDHRRDLPVPKLVAGQGPRAAEARSELGRRRQGKAGRPRLCAFLDQASRTWSRLLHRPGPRPRGLGGRALPPPSARGNPLGDRRALRVLLAGLGAVLALGPSTVRADATYEMLLRTEDRLVGGTVELEERIVVSVKGHRLRQEATGSRAVVTRRGARYTKPGKSLTLDQLDRGRRFEIDPDTGTYVEQAFADIRRRREAELSGAEKALGIDSAEAPPALPVSVDRTGERLQVHGRHCERVVLSSTREAVVGAGRGAPEARATPARFAMTFDLCLAPDVPAVAEARAL